MSITKELTSRKSGVPVVRVEPPSLPLRQDDPFVDCVWAQVETESVTESVAKVIITISLGRAEITPRCLGGRVRLGLKHVKLRLYAKGGQIPHQDRWPKHEAETSISVEQTEERRHRQEESSKSGAKAKVDATSATGEATNERGNNVGEEETTRRTFRIVELKVRSGGSETSAYWEFRALKPKDVLDFDLKSQEVASFLITEHETLITCGIEFMDSDLRILGSEGLFTGRAGSDDVSKWGLVLGVVRKALASDLRKAVELPSKVEET